MRRRRMVNRLRRWSAASTTRAKARFRCRRRTIIRRAPSSGISRRVTVLLSGPRQSRIDLLIISPTKSRWLVPGPGGAVSEASADGLAKRRRQARGGVARAFAQGLEARDAPGRLSRGSLLSRWHARGAGRLLERVRDQEK